jgi:PGM1 C-terminal domain
VNPFDNADPPSAAPHDDRECAEFEKLKPRLVELWRHVFPADDEPYTSVVVPSTTADTRQLLHDGTFLEERLLFLMIRLRNPFARLVYVTSRPIHPMVVEYYLQLLVGTPASHARRRLTLLSVHDSSPRPLTAKLLERPRLLRRIQAAIPDLARAYLTVPHSTPLERRLAVALGIPLNAPDPRLMALGTKSRGRVLLRDAGLAVPEGAEDLRSEGEVVAALRDMRQRRPGLRAAVLKIDDGFAGEANALFEYPRDDDYGRSLAALMPSTPRATPADFLETLARRGGVVEELLEGEDLTSPSVQLRINPHGEVFVTSTHEQALGGPIGQLYQGCEFPARRAYREELQRQGTAVARRLAALGVVGRLSIDFVVTESDAATGGRPVAVDLNLRMGGTTHPMLALRFLTGGEYDPATGRFLDAASRAKYYLATDHLESEAYRRLLPDDLVEILTVHKLQYDHRSATGVVFHMLGGVSEQGRIGVVAIGDDRRQARDLFHQVRDVLDAEAAS